MTFGQIFDRTFSGCCARNSKLFIAVATVPAVATILIMALFFAIAFVPIFSQLPRQPDPRADVSFDDPSMLLIMPLSLAVFALYLAASIHAAMQADLGIRSPSARLIKWPGSGLAATSG